MAVTSLPLCDADKLKNLSQFSRGNYILRVCVSEDETKYTGIIYRVLFACPLKAELQRIGQCTDFTRLSGWNIDTISDPHDFTNWVHTYDLNKSYFDAVNKVLDYWRQFISNQRDEDIFRS